MGLKARKKRVRRWWTASGVLVEQRGLVRVVRGIRKIMAYRVPTGGFHGLLHVKHLTPVRGLFRSVEDVA